METLGYNQSWIAYEQETGVEYEMPDLALNWQKIPNSAWMGLLSVAVILGAVGTAEQATAALYAKTNGSCLNARTGPGTNYKVHTCVRNGARLAEPVSWSGNWIKLSTGRWVDGRYTSTSPTGRQGFRTTSNTARVRPGVRPAGTVVLSVGSQGALVAKVQSKLSSLGYSIGPYDGAYGPLTKAAVMRFQRSKGLTVDGVVGPSTSAAMGLSI
ncbi:MAG: peptidoglycan-binding protein [Jaaginema sp. PMC 1079.18]|nr:peptidoglycan-binding protein [Jaaginema sp. PMC 1080.18]MEC4852911.1 peptidoglycan-binding protein [Jaaginema sp. PMC 1079.18]MEC4868792.1 peptidoglycan-binding protein [Jaaginema sp. PMC 1078.18]